MTSPCGRAGEGGAASATAVREPEGFAAEVPEAAEAVEAGEAAERAAPVGVRVRRIEGLLLGLAAGDAAGWPAARHRAARMPEWTRRLTRELDTFAEQNATTTLPVPIALNQPPNRCGSVPRTTPSGRRSRRRPSCGPGRPPRSAT